MEYLTPRDIECLRLLECTHDAYCISISDLARLRDIDIVTMDGILTIKGVELLTKHNMHDAEERYRLKTIRTHRQVKP
jgi:hypothetical protein